MKIVVRRKSEDWRGRFTIVVEIDDRFEQMLPEEFIRKHLTRVVGAALCDLQHPVLATLMHELDEGVLDLKRRAADGLMASIGCHEALKCARRKKGKGKDRFEETEL